MKTKETPYQNIRTVAPRMHQYVYVITTLGEKALVEFMGDHWIKFKPADDPTPKIRYELYEVAGWKAS